jgi:16S rRNA (guanine966-N2)-methyltransferase
VTRIIAGAARGRRLAVPAAGTRPTSDRVREAIFSTLDSQFAADDVAWSTLRVLDLFAGSGALGLEALSRGAHSAVLVEKSREAARVLAANVDAVDCPGAEVLVRDVRRLVTVPPPDGGAGLVFLDPPYDWPARDVRDLVEGLRVAGWIAEGAPVVVERPARDPDSPIPEDWQEPRRRPYGDTMLWYGRCAPTTDAGIAGEEGV